MTDVTLNPCPFCASESVEFANLSHEDYVQFVCAGCGASGPQFQTDADLDAQRCAELHWNSRPAWWVEKPLICAICDGDNGHRLSCPVLNIKCDVIEMSAAPASSLSSNPRNTQESDSEV